MLDEVGRRLSFLKKQLRTHKRGNRYMRERPVRKRKMIKPTKREDEKR